MSGLDPKRAAARLAMLHSLTPRAAALLAQLLAGADTGRARAVSVAISRLRKRLGPIFNVACKEQDGSPRDNPRLRSKASVGYVLVESSRQTLLLAAEGLADPAPTHPLRQCPRGLNLRGGEAVIHHVLVAVGSGMATRADLTAALLAAGYGGTDNLINVRLCALRKKTAAAGLEIETNYGRGWRYRTDTLNAYLAAHPAPAPAPHLAPIKKEPGLAR